MNDEDELEALRRRVADLEAESALWRMLCENAPDFMTLVDESGRFLWYNRRHPDLSHEQVLSSSIFDFEVPQNAAAVRRAFRDAMETGDGLFESHYFVGKLEYWSHSRLLRVSREPRRFLLMTSDITRQRLAERALQDTGAQLRAGQRLAQLGTWEWWFGRESVEWNDELYEMMGLSPEQEVTKDLVLASAYPADLPQSIATTRLGIERDEPFTFQQRILRRDGEVRHLMVRGEVLKDSDGKPQKLRGCALDVTRVHRAERAAHFWEAGLRAALKAAKQLVYDWDPETDALSLAGDLEQFFGDSRPPTTGTEWGAALRPPSPDFFAKRRRELASRRWALQERYDLMRQGQVLGVQDHAELVAGPDGRLRVVGLVADISVQKEEQERWQHEVQQRDAMLREVHHRIKNNLQMLMSLAYLQLGQQGPGQELLARLGLRVRAMALSYDLAEGSDGEELVPANEHLGQLIEASRAVFCEAGLKIVWRPGTRAVRMSAGSASHCGLLLLELVTLAHECVRASGSGELLITLAVTNPNVASLSFELDGLKQAASADWDGRIAAALSAQMKGELDMAAPDVNGIRFRFAVAPRGAAAEGEPPDGEIRLQ